MRAFLAGLSLLALAIAGSAQVDDIPSPSPVPHTTQPRQLQWRIGFDLGNATILETPELNPDGDYKRAVSDAQHVIKSALLSFGLALLPYSKMEISDLRLVNPKDWTILDLHNKTTRKSFQYLGVFMGTRMTTTEGGYHLVSLAVPAQDAFLGTRKEPAPGDLIFGFSGPIKRRLQLRTKLAETKWENLLPVEDPTALPAGYEAAKQLLDDHKDEGPRYLYGTSIEATVGNRLSTAWLLNYSHPDTTKGTHPWGIFVEEEGGLRPLYIYKPSGIDEPFVAYFTASLDLNQDGADEFVVEASYRVGTAYKVISSVNGKYQEVFTSYYRGPR
jgi:hypothetical protein